MTGPSLPVSGRSAGAGEPSEARTEWGKDLPKCEAIGCPYYADWAFTEPGHEMYLCMFHGGGKDPVEGWQWIGE